MKRIAVLTSGGDAPGMNAAIRAVIRTAIYYDMEVMGIKEGYSGLLRGELFKMDLSSVADIIHRGGTILRTSRSEEFRTEKGVKKAAKIIEIFGIDAVIIIGGNGSIKGANELRKEGVSVIGIPCTIDNDCGWSDYSIGYLTAMETIVEAISKIRDTSTSHGRANVMEVMGRNCGDLALNSGLAGGAESIIIPEIKLNIEEVCKKVLQGKARGKKHHIIVLAEGAGNAYEVAESVIKNTGVDTRVTILGYIQRGGSPIAMDRNIASIMGNQAVELLYRDISNKALGFNQNEIQHYDLSEALKMEKVVDMRLYEVAQKLSI